jgi:hypothetical protein
LTARRTRKFTRKKPPDFVIESGLRETSTPRQVASDLANAEQF